MAQASVDSLTKRCTTAEGVKNLCRSMHEEAYKLAIPSRNLYTAQAQGQRKDIGLYTSAGTNGIDSFVNNMQASVTPPFTRWCSIQAGPLVKKEDRKKANEALKEINDLVFAVIDNSNFSLASAEGYYDLAVGTMCLLVLPGDNDRIINNQAIPLEQIALEAGKFNTIGAIFRSHKIAGRLIKQTWKDATIGAVLQKKITEKPEEEIEFKECCYWDEDDFVWRYEILEPETKERIVQRKYKTNPFIVLRWSVVPGEVFGRGVIIKNLANLKRLNKINELGLKQLIMDLFGIYTVSDDSVMNLDNINFEPPIFIPVKRNDNTNPSIRVLERAGSTDLQQFEVDKLEQEIKSGLLAKKLPAEAGPVRSPTEIVERVKEMQFDTGSSFGRLMSEFVIPYIVRVIDILDEKKLITLPEGFKIDNLLYQIKMLSPIAKKQALEDVQNITEANSIANGISPQANQIVVDEIKIVEFVHRSLGTPEDMIRDEDEQEQKKEEIAAIMTQAAGAQQPTEEAPQQ